MRKIFNSPHSLLLGILLFAVFGLLAPKLIAQDAATAISKEKIEALDKELNAAKAATSEARQRIDVRRVIRAAEDLVAAHANDTSRFLALEFLFRAYQRLIALDKDVENRKALLAICHELVKAPDELAALRLEADILLSQAEVAKQGANTEARAKALRPLIDRYVNTPVAAKVLRMTMLMALELGDSKLVTDLQEMIEQRFIRDLEMIAFLRDKLGGQVFGAPFSGTFKRSDGKMVRLPMDTLGRSTMLFFWSKENGGEDLLKGIAAAALEKKADLDGRLEFISFNLDELPDAGESFIRSLGVNWQVLHLPGGKKNPIYNAFVREGRTLMVNPTGYAALVMAGMNRKKVQSDDKPDYIGMFQHYLGQPWNEPRCVMQINSLLIGDFLVCDPEGRLNPTLPPELKAYAMSEKPQPLARIATSVPEETLQAIQDCFVAPPFRYRLSIAEARANYTKAVDLCRKALIDHVAAPDLWIVRNRLIIALTGLWKSEANLSKREEAVTEAKAALAAGYPPGCDVVARFCLAREALRDPSVNPLTVISQFVAENGGDKAPGAVLSVAALLSLDVADRKSFEDYRRAILKNHTEYPMMWTFASFLLDRYHSYYLFQVPFGAGWTYNNRESYFLSIGDAEEAHRILRTELSTDKGKPLRIPEDLDSEWTVIVFAKSPPWSIKNDDRLPTSPKGLLKGLNAIATSRPKGDVKVLLAQLGGDVTPARAALDDPIWPHYKVECPIVTVPGGTDNPLMKRLGVLSEDLKLNSVLVNKDGRIAVMLSGIDHCAHVIGNVIMHEDEKAIAAALQRGDIQAAKDKIFALAPPFDPNAVDALGNKLPKPPANSNDHLRARARVYMALKEWDKALADAKEVVQRQTGIDGSLSMRTDELDASEQLRDSILELCKK